MQIFGYRQAQDVIDAAIADGGYQKEIDKAQAEMVKAQKDLDNNKPHKAIYHYSKACYHAPKAVNYSQVRYLFKSICNLWKGFAFSQSRFHR